ncbi:hypothetical protein PC129_g20969 [Phytophthora cactorum]|uniref:Uncharacterized protein n=1 Tax=Phytophthora cactorum TaxID=29920 RepID=A0A329SG12_9STRA|nr:hypothetical protein PC111_g20749 [Phytophthora cactorum]KAG2844338.1 hypothetical protein PC112_g2272 [Phytophthora cactorum]KAG2866972.1 hypothetical protein PC113_g2399 [Phytophthora cactorum]KAG2932152.1 hypothetical protein PC114_g1932 [Phytophthora cactorum]KAG2941877.1 hypothetical protein PC115_g1715 [Phytophthora cactorum]
MKSTSADQASGLQSSRGVGRVASPRLKKPGELVWDDEKDTREDLTGEGCGVEASAYAPPSSGTCEYHDDTCRERRSLVWKRHAGNEIRIQDEEQA